MTTIDDINFWGESESSTEKSLLLVATAIEKPKTTALEYPFSFIGTNDGGYYTNEFSEGLLDEEKVDIGDFPNNIDEYYWIHEGANDEETWHLLCRVSLGAAKGGDNFAYVYYTASCDYTGFDCQGQMKIVASMSLKKLIESGMTEQTRCLLIKDRETLHVDNKISEQKWKNILDSIKQAAPDVANINGEKAFIRLWNDDKELDLTLNELNGIEMNELEYAITGLTAQFMNNPIDINTYQMKYSKPVKKYYSVFVLGGVVSGVDDYFRRRFGDPNKKWELRMCQKSYCRKWGKVEVSFTIY
jgi:hypothetical protein